jgi:hypothetical protein
VIPQYSDKPLHRTHVPPERSDGTPPRAEEQRACLRLDFAFRCVYCLSHEREVGPGYRYGGFEIEHFRPKGKKDFRHLRHIYKNLLWACATCNRAKGKRWPTAELLSQGNRFVDPSVEGMGKHVELSGLDDIGHRSQAGWYIIRMLNLRSSTHRERRRERNERAKKYELVKAVLEQQEAAVNDLRTEGQDTSAAMKLVEVQRERLEEARKQVEWSAPFDAPGGCEACKPARGLAARPF